MTSDKKPFTWNLKQCKLIHFRKQKQTHWHKQRSFNLAEFRKLPEGFRKLTGRLVCLFSVSLQFRKVPEGFRKLTGSLFGVVVLPKSRKLPEGFRKSLQKGSESCLP